MLRIAIWIGTVAGGVLALFLWLVENQTGIKVFTLLINIDFITERKFPILIEVFFHFIISWGICLVFVEIINRKKSTDAFFRWKIAFLLSGIAAITYFPLTLLAIKETPSVTDWWGILYWFIGHFLYACTINILSSKIIPDIR